jgi:FkbM family methyltransferase
MVTFANIRSYAFQVGWRAYLWRTAVRQFYKRILRRDLEIRLPTGLPLHLPRDSHFASVVWLTQGRADEGCEEMLLRFLKPVADFLDIGAHLGYYSLWYAPRVRQIHAFEPDPRNHRWLERNSLRAANVRVNHLAVSDRTGTVEFRQDASSAQSHVLTDGHRKGEACISVPCTTIDTYWKQNGQGSVCAFKVDVEGHEISVLRGAAEMLKACRPMGLIETSHTNREKLIGVLEPLRYKAIAAVRSGREIVLMEMNNRFSETHDFTMAFLVPEEKYLEWNAGSGRSKRAI